MILVVAENEDSFLVDFLTEEQLERLWMEGKAIFELHSDGVLKFQGLDRWEEIEISSFMVD